MLAKIFGIGLVFVMVGSMVGGLPVLVREVEASPGTIYVPDNYTKIQWAVDNATSGDTIIVRDGTYTENVDVNIANLTMQSENGTANCVVNAANPDDHVFNVTADWVNIIGFTVQGATGYPEAGIYLGGGTAHCNISSNNATNNYYGIYLFGSTNNTLSSNTASNNEYGIVMSYSSNNNTLTHNTANSNNGYGIYLYSSSNNMLTNNTCSSNGQYGISLDDSSNNTLRDNTASHNQDGIHLCNSSSNTVTNNTWSNNDLCGIYLQFSSNNNTVTNNTCSNNSQGGIELMWSSSNNTLSNNTASNNDFGILLYLSSNNTLANNTMVDDGIIVLGGLLEAWNTHTIDTSNKVNGRPVHYWKNKAGGVVPAGAGQIILTNCTHVTVQNQNISNVDIAILLGYCNNNTLTNNTCSNNSQYGIELMWSSNNTIYNNYFNNTNNVYDNGNNAWNTTKTLGTNIIGGPYIGGNYWSDYAGSDTNGDGLGDTSYNISGGSNKDYLPLLVWTGATLEGHVDLSGFPATNVTVRFFTPNTTTEYVAMKTHTTTDSNGNFTIGNLAPGTYDVAVKGQTSLSNLVSGVNLTDGNTTVVDFGVLLEGDALSSNDDYIDMSDYGPLSSAWLSYPGCSPPLVWDPDVDFSRDNYIDMSDYGPLSANWLDWGDCFGWPGDWL